MADYRDIHRIAVLRTGVEFLGIEDPLVEKLYAVLAVLADDRAFIVRDAALLLYDDASTSYALKSAKGAVVVLERWVVPRVYTCSFYIMHEAHL